MHGMCVDKLQHVRHFLPRYVDEGKLPGYLCLISRRGEEALFGAHGLMDVARQRAIARDTVFRIYSMTKPVTSVALMMLYERGLFQLDDPVARYIPQWRKLKVFAGGDAESYDVRDPDRPMTVKDLLTHTSGLTYGFLHAHPVDAMYRAAGIGGLGRQGTLQSMVDDLAELPLQFSPGARWNYSVSTDVAGYLVQRLADCDLDDFVAEQITGPLGMTDSGFFVPGGAAERLAACYERVPKTSGFRLQDDPAASAYLERPAFLSGGGGMVSTIDDYHRFCRMLAGKGEVDGVRLLGRKTVEYMTINHLPGNRDLAAMGQPTFSETSYDGIGFGLGFSVVLDPAAANVIDSPGEFAWGGAASTYFFIDPVEDLIVIFMTQLLPSSSYPVRRQLKALAYQAIVD
ncbi:MAG: serine hydrolase domain-containing protein [Pseudomonadales bacterium]